MIDRSCVTGLVLSGGRGTRMGSVDKGLELFDGRTLVAHALSRLAEGAGRLLISANRHRDRYEALGREFDAAVVEDGIADYPGPLAGLLAGLTACTTDLLVAVPCDAPFFPLDLVARLTAVLDEDVDVVIAATSVRMHPVFCMMRPNVAPGLARYLADGGRRVHGWLATMRVRAVTFADEAAFRNLNSFEELRDAQTSAVPVPMSPDASPLSLTEAQERIAAAIVPVTASEPVPLLAALGRFVAHDLVSTVAVPAHDNSAMDGYALASDVAAPRRLRIVGRAYAGRPHAGPVGPGECVRIMTGAVMPDGCDAVVPQEIAVAGSDFVSIADVVQAGQHRRRAGEDIAVGATVLARGRSIAPADLGLAASIGASTLTVVRRLRVAIFSTGDELRAVDEPLAPGSVHDANRYTIAGMLAVPGIDVVDLGIVVDDPAALEATLRKACESCDAVVTSGGVSAGDADHTRDVMKRLGEIEFWSLAIKPGRPMAFGRIASAGRSAVLFALPGNPVAVMVVFHALVRNALVRMAGGVPVPLPAITACVDAPLPKSPGRTEFIRAIAFRETDGWHVRPTGTQSSGVLRSMSEANCLIVLDHERGPVARGEPVEAWPFHGLT